MAEGMAGVLKRIGMLCKPSSLKLMSTETGEEIKEETEMKAKMKNVRPKVKRVQEMSVLGYKAWKGGDMEVTLEDRTSEAGKAKAVPSTPMPKPPITASALTAPAAVAMAICFCLLFMSKRMIGTSEKTLR